MEQKVALVTGASRGIGRAIALKLAAQDMYVIVNYASSAEKAQAVLGEIRAAGGDGCCMGWDVSDFTATENAMKEIIRTCGHLDVVVNNAGITRDGLLMSMKEEDYDRVLDVNLKGAFFVIRFAARQMLKQRSGRDHQHFFGERPPGKCRTGQLLCRQSGTSGTDEIRCPGAGQPGHHSQCHCAGIY